MKTKSRAKQLKTGFVLICFIFSSLACSQGYISPVELTATAQANSVQNNTQAIAVVTATPNDPTVTATQTSTNEPSATATTYNTPTLDPNATPKPPIQYYTQSGDTLPSILGRFGIVKDQITFTQNIPETGLISPNILLIIPDVLTDVYDSTLVMPDSEVVYSPSAIGFDIETFVNQAGGYLSRYTEEISGGPQSGAQIVNKVALENSVNPRLLLAILEYKSHWVYGQPRNLAETDYPMGMVDLDYKGLYRQLSWTVSQLSIGYYGWRAGTLSYLPFKDGTNLRVSPGVNAGTAAVQYLFAQWYDKMEWIAALYGENSMPDLMTAMYGNFLIYSQAVEPLYAPDLQQPVLELPFGKGRTWAFISGPHSAWGPEGALAALDFAPPVKNCDTTEEWVTAMAGGVIVRSEDGAVIQDLDGDGNEQTGWNIMYMHIETRDRVAVGTYVDTNGHIGHPSCEGGIATGTHTHIARKYNGEWILADGPIPFNMSGWIAHNGSKAYEGTLTNGTMTLYNDTLGSTAITRLK